MCQLVDPELFFPISAAGKSLEQIAEAKMVCARCLVQPECLTFAQRTGQAHGIWGGLTEEERVRVARSGNRLNAAAVRVLRGVPVPDVTPGLQQPPQPAGQAGPDSRSSFPPTATTGTGEPERSSTDNSWRTS